MPASGPTIRLQVYVHAASPELHADLAQLPPRARPERLRTLAALGLLMLRAPPPTLALPFAPDAAPDAAPAATPAANGADPDQPRRDALLRRLTFDD